MQRLIAAIVLVVICSIRPTMAAEDSAAVYLAKLFSNACVLNNDDPAKVHAWAADHTLQKITDPEALSLFVSKDGKGEAWSVPSASGHFSLSIRGATEACAVWARAADAAEVEVYFKKIIASTERAGVHVKVMHDSKSESPSGVIHNLIYQVTSDDKAANGFAFTMLTLEEPGNIFQATLQEARFTPQ